MRVVVADDHPAARAGIAAAIRKHPDLVLVGEASDGAEALDQIRELRPDVALLDLEMPRLDALEVLAALARELLPTRVLVISELADGAVVHEAVAAGAAGYLTKREPLRAISGAIRSVARGRRHLSADAQTALLDELERRLRSRPLLTERELEILRLTAAGVSSAEIARQLYLSESTVKNHQQHAYRKLGVAKAPAAVYEAMRRGLL